VSGVVAQWAAAAVVAALVIVDVAVGRLRSARPIRHARRVRYVPGARPPAPLPEVEEWEL
jgi:hypothetical protein